MLQLDHFALFSHNFYESTFRVSQESGLGNYDGGFFPTYGTGIKIVPLGPDLFLEIEGLVDYAAMKREIAEPTPFASKILEKPECFGGWAFRTDTEEELEELAKACGWQVNREFLNETNAQQMMNGDKNIVYMAPTAPESWPSGMPNTYFWPYMDKHDSRYPVEAGTGTRTPKGLAWIEVGGTEKQFEDWFCGMTKASDHPIKFNGKSLGLYAIAVDTDDGEVVIRRPCITE